MTAKTDWVTGDEVTAAALNTLGGEVNTRLTTSAAPELIRDTIGTALVAGSNVTITPNDGADTITIAASGGGGGDVAGDTHAAASKTTPVDADEVPLVDSAASFGLKRLTVANLKAWVKSWIAKGDVGLDNVTNNAQYYPGGTDVAVTDGGTGRSTSTTAYGLIAAGTTATGAQQTIGPGSAGQVLKSAGGSALASFAALASADISDAVRTVAVATGSETRPSTTGVVLWIGGGTQPTNMVAGDLWLQGVSVVAPTITTTTLSALTQGSAFSQTLAATGDTPITWSVTTGSLPAGLSLSSGGALTGTPSAAGAYSFTVTATNAGGSDTQAYSGTVSAASSDPWVRRSVVQSARNASTTHTVNFTAATSGNLLVMVADASASITTPSGWTRRGQALSNTELSVYTKTASAAESSVSMVTSASNYPLGAVIYEFGSAATWVNGVQAVTLANAGSANPNLTGLTGTNLVFAATAMSALSGNSASSVVWTASPTNPTEDLDVFVPFSDTDGYLLSVCYIAGYTGASFAPTTAVTIAASGVTREALTFAVNVP